MKEKILRGCGTALVTPFRDGAVDFEALGGILEMQKAAGVHFLVPLGTTAETPCLSSTEKVDILVFTKERCPDLPIVVGAGSNSLSGTLENMRLLSPCSPDAFLVVVPFYNKPTQEGLYRYFRAVAESTDRNIVLYNVPSRTGTNMLAETTLRLAEIPNIVAVKEASGNYAQIAEIIRCAPGGFSVLSGNDDETLSLMATGADGVISVVSNLAPEPMVKLVEALWEDRMDEAREVFMRLLPLCKGCFVEPSPVPVKAGMSLRGFLRNELRLPLTPAAPATVELMKKLISTL